MYKDYHCHMLPLMDDGAKTVDIAIEMLNKAYNQNVDTIVFTPHFYNEKDDVTSFLKRRENSYNLLKEKSESLPNINFYFGAEVYLTKNISKIEGLDKLCIKNTNYLLLEMPYKPLSQWMLDEIDELAYSRLFKIIFAHVDRYVYIYNKKDYELLFTTENSVCQINNEAFNSKKGLKLLKHLQNKNIPIVLGSDAHNLIKRPPNFNLVSENEKIFDNNYCEKLL